MMASTSVPSTPRNNINSVRTPRRLCRRSTAPAETPECVNYVSVETPSSVKRRISREKGNEISNLVTVAIRVRPMNSRELCSATVYDTISVEQNEIVVKVLNPGNAGLGTNHLFQYDHVFWSVDPTKPGYASQEDVFLSIGKPMLDSAFKGYNACLFAYGQTGSGKSYSMMGESADIGVERNESAGVIPRFCYDLFQRISELPPSCSASVDISYFELYNEKIFDLLTVAPSAMDKRTPLKVREHPVWGPYVVNLSPHNVKSYREIRDLIQRGNKKRVTGATLANEKSSRSHSIVTIELSICELEQQGGDAGRRSKISLVDLAGSERVGGTNSNNSSTDDRHREGVSINQSLLTLGKVIAALSDSKRTHTFVPYRESMLTWLLRESLGGNSLTSMLATISPASSHVDETLATLRYACQARSIVNRAYVNENPHDRLIRELRAEVERLRALRQDYERHSVGPVTNITITPSAQSNTTVQELEDLRTRLSETEQHLEEAQREWERRFLETKQQQMHELLEAEKRKQELESHVRVMSSVAVDHSASAPVVCPFQSNFLDKLEDVLIVDKTNGYAEQVQTLLKDTKKWCASHGMEVDFEVQSASPSASPSNKIVVRDRINNMWAVCSVEHLESRVQYDEVPGNFLNCLQWKCDDERWQRQRQRQLQRHQQQQQQVRGIPTSVWSGWQQMRDGAAALSLALPPDDPLLTTAIAHLNEALHTFYTVLNQKYRPPNKTVTFQS